MPRYTLIPKNAVSKYLPLLLLHFFFYCRLHGFFVLYIFIILLRSKYLFKRFILICRI